MSNHLFCINGEFVPAETASLPVTDLGLIRGYGVFDVLRTYNRIPFKLREHVARLQKSGRAIHIESGRSNEEIEEMVLELLARNYAADPTLEDVFVRLVLTGGSSSNGFTPEQKPSLIIMFLPAGAADKERFKNGGRLFTVEAERFLPAVKSLNYITAILAAEEAAAAGASEALYRTTDGYVTEGTRTSFFVVRGNKLITSSHPVLDGITRRVVMEIGADRFEVAEEPIAYADLRSVDEAILVGTGTEILPIVQIDDIQIGDGNPGPVAQELIQQFRAYVAAEAAKL